MTVGLPLMKSVLTPLAKSVLLTFVLSAVMSATDVVIKKKKKKKKKSWFGINRINNLKCINGRYNETS